MSFGSDLLSLAPSAVVGAGSNLLGSILGSVAAGRQAKKQYKYSQALMQQQHAYELENMSELERIQRGLALDSSLLRRQSLEKAGYNVADPEGTGTQAPSMSAPSTSASGSFSMPGAPYIDTASGISAVANAQLTSSQARLNDIEAQYRAKKLGAEIEYTNTKIEQIQETLQPTIDNLLQDLNNKRKQVELNDQQIQEISAHMEQLSALTAGIRIDNRYKDQLNENTIKKLHAETVKLVHEGNIKGIEAELAKVGILVDANWMTQLLAVMHLGTGTEVMQDIVSTAGSMMSALPGALSQVLSSVIDAMASAVFDIPKSVW